MEEAGDYGLVAHRHGRTQGPVRLPLVWVPLARAGPGRAADPGAARPPYTAAAAEYASVCLDQFQRRRRVALLRGWEEGA